jgi:hypothetical protein
MASSVPDLRRAPHAQPPGWWRWAGIGGGIVVVLLFLALAVGVFSARRVLVWGLSRVTSAVVGAIPAEVPAARRDELRRRLDCVVRQAQAGRADHRRLGELSRACTEALRDRRLTPEEMERIELLAGALCAEGGGDLPN